MQRVDIQGEDTVLWFPPPVFGGEYQIGRDFHGYLVNLIHRYFVTFVHNLQELDLQFQSLSLDRYFGGIEVIFVRDDGTNVGARIWQRGGREIAGSGTGASAAAATLWRLGRWREPLDLAMRGGTVTMYYDGQGRFIQHAAVAQISEGLVDEKLLWKCKI
jgi:diaminopimelate epimerase